MEGEQNENSSRKSIKDKRESIFSPLRFLLIHLCQPEESTTLHKIMIIICFDQLYTSSVSHVNFRVTKLTSEHTMYNVTLGSIVFLTLENNVFKQLNIHHYCVRTCEEQQEYIINLTSSFFNPC